MEGLKPQGGELTIKLDDGTTLKSRVKGVAIDRDTSYDEVFTDYGTAPMRYITDEIYTLEAKFDGAYTIFNAPTAAHRVRVNVTDASIKGLMQVQKSLNVPDTAQMSVKQHPTNDDMAVVTFTWEA